MNAFKLLIAIAMVLSACGTRDYKDKPAENQERKTEGSKTPAPTGDKRLTNTETGVPALFRRTAAEGMLWRMAAGNPFVDRLKCELRDGSQVSYIETLAYQAFGGIILGLIYKRAGAYYVGAPVAPTSDPQKALPVGEPVDSRWAWRRIYLDGERAKQGVARGFAMATLCGHFLGPGIFFLHDGLFGRDFNALSTALTLGIMSAGAAKPYLSYFARGGFGEPVEDPDKNNSRGRYAIMKLSRALSYGGQKHYTGRAIMPNLLAISIGGGVGVLVYSSLQHAGPDAPPEEPINCSPATDVGGEKQ